tara:strand:+ start:5392 stop:5631 length:240 start_codon:yes stop_codon:yes gene_type:complete
MDKKEILNQVQEIFRDQLDDEYLVLKSETTAMDVDEWDSLNHLMLVVGIEKHFNLKFTSKEIISLTNIGDIVNCIDGKI